MRRSMLLLSLMLVAAAPGAARAALFGDASIAYSAERTVTVNGKSYSGMVFHIPGHERHEQTIQGVAEVVILDAASKQGFLVVPMLKTYVTFAFPRLMAELDDPALRRAPVGQETVNGVRTTKYRIDHVSADGSRAQGNAWLSAQGVLMRIDGTLTRDGGGRPVAIRMELANLAVGPQDPTLFQVPPGLAKLPAAALEGLLGSHPG
ncbi:MAG: hypothetical protein ACLQJR_24970 [Stellaceae bacterium]